MENRDQKSGVVKGSSLRTKLKILDSLLQNKELETFVMDGNRNFGSLESCRALGELLRTSTTLKHLSLYGVEMREEGLKLIVEGILDNSQSALEALDLGNNELTLHHVDGNVVANEVDEGTAQSTDPVDSLEAWKALGKLVGTSTTLKHLSLNFLHMWGEHLIHIVEGILKNSESALETLNLRGNVNLGSRDTTGHNDNTYVGEGAKQLTDLLLDNTRALATLDIGSIWFSAGDMKSIGKALASNTTLINLTLGDPWQGRRDRHNSYRESWKLLFDSLQSNKSLQKAELVVERDTLDDVFEDLMGIFRVNYTIREMPLVMGELDELYGERRNQFEGMLLRNQRLGEYMNTLQKHLTFVKPSIGRLFLCGSPLAGKTTLRTSMVASQAGWKKKAKNKAKSVLQQNHFLRQTNERTRGIEVQSLKAVSDGGQMEEQIAIWDMAGQEEYRALHDSHFLFPDINQACLFMFVFTAFDESKQQCDFTEASSRLEKELTYWLSFINSNSRIGDFILPKVSIVLTHLDMLTKMGQCSSEKTYVEWAEEKVKKIRDRFRGKVQVDEVIHAVHSHSHEHARAVAKHVTTIFHDLFGKVGEMPAVCKQITVLLRRWILDHKLQPIMGTTEFLQLCRKEVPDVTKLFRNVPTDLPGNVVAGHGNKVWQAITSYLHDSGCILQFPKSDSIVVNVNWLGETFLGRLFNSKDTNMQQMIQHSENYRGMVHNLNLKSFLDKFVQKGKYRGMNAEVLVHLMKEMKICEDVNSSELFMPNTLKDAEGKAYSGRRKLQWSDMGGDYEHPPVCTGLRLQAEDPMRTFLSPGLFLRYQVHLHRLLSRDIEEGRFSYEIEANLIRVKHDGMEMLIESSGEMRNGDYMDILIRCYDAPASRDHYTYKYGVSELRKFCASREGCPGVFLKEAILRPECAERLTLCVDRRNQAVFTESLKRIVKEKLFQYVGELQASGNPMWNQGDSAKTIIEQSIGSKIYRHRFDAVEHAELGEVWVKATSLLDDWTGINNALINHGRLALQKVATDYQAADEVQREIKAAISANPQPSTSSPSSPSPSARETTSGHPFDDDHTLSKPFDDQDKDPVTRRDFEMLLQVHLQKFERRISLRLERNKNEILSGTKTALEYVVNHMRKIQLWQEQQISMMQKLEQVAVLTQEQSRMPRFPYFSRFDVKLGKKIIALKVIGEASMLHFMCEEPRQRHFVKDQTGFDITLLNQEKWAKTLRPIISASVDTFLILAKAAAHVGAGIGNVIPDFSSLQGAIPLNTISLATETALNEIRRTDSDTVDHDGSTINAWKCLMDEIVKPLVKKNEISKVFGLYQVQYKPKHLTKHLPTSHYWVCSKCREKAYKANELVEDSSQIEFLHVVGKSDSRYDWR